MTERKSLRNILFCTSGYFPDKSGGSQHQAKLQAEELVKRGYSVTVVCPRLDDTDSGVVEGVKVHRLATVGHRRVRLFSYSLHLLFFLAWQIRRYQVLHLHMTRHDAVVICVMARLWRRPVYAKVARGGNTGDAHFLDGRKYRRWLAMPYPRRYQAISDEIVADLLSVGVPAARIVRLPNGVELPVSRPLGEPARRQLRGRLELPPDDVIVLFLGRFVAMKGLDVLVEAWSGVTNPNTTLLLVGRRPQDRDGVLLASNMSIDEEGPRIIVHDWTDTPADYMDAADIFVLPSRSEGMSNALLTAMAHGLAVVATRVGAAEAMIEDGVSGRLIQPDDPAALREVLVSLIDDPARRASLGNAARRRVAERYSIGSVVDRIEAEYLAILHQRKAVVVKP